MSLVKFEIDALYSQEQLDWVPENKWNFAEAQKTFEKYTGDSSSKIYSGYRAELLALKTNSKQEDLVAQWRDNFETLLVVGIGGSSLGAQSVIEALSWSVDSKQKRKVCFLDNLDPIHFHLQVDACDLKKTAVLVVSKSGGTIESLVNATLLVEKYKEAKMDLSKHFAVVTTEGHGDLWNWSQSASLPAFNLAKSVGGRYSVFTPVGSIPIAFSGVDCGKFLKGAQEIFQTQAEQNLQKLSARLLDLAERGHNNLVQFMYSSLLFSYGRWFQQLWAESLGKIQASGVPMGTCPLPCVGANDQHSLLQLFMEGPSFNSYAFISLENWPSSVDPIFKAPSFFKTTEFASNRTMSEILNKEAAATFEALKKVGRPVFEIKLQNLSPQVVGALYGLSMDWTVFSACLKKINPFDQNGVESGKLILRHLLKN
ncbi:MAG: hypothetical protein KA116_07120 [Proteobacteria bacterium]|nr:hypothetical protein [Pseudomonadota bacterium]